MEIISRADAKRAGLKRYFTGEACKRGHVSERYTCSGTKCIECDRINTLKYFTPEKIENRKARQRAYESKHRDLEKKRAQERDRRKNNPEKTRNYKLLKNYGITLFQWNEMFEAQGRRCAICRNSDPQNRMGWHTDHCHSTGKVRGILCNGCNTSLGLVCESIDTLTHMTSYLVRHKGVAAFQ